MRKQTISKIAALALAAMSVVPSFGMTASATVTKTLATAATGGENVITGSAYLLKWSTRKTVYKYRAAQNADGTYTLTDIKMGVTDYSSTDAQQTVTPAYSPITVKANGHIYYCDNYYKPKDYTDLDNALNEAKTGLAKAKADFKKIYDDYNRDITELNKARKNADNAIRLDNDGNVVKGTATFTDSKGYSVTVVSSAVGSYAYYYTNGFNKDSYTGTAWNIPADPGKADFAYDVLEKAYVTTDEKGMPQLANELGTIVSIDTEGIITSTPAGDAKTAGIYRIQITSNNGSGDGTTTTVVGPGSGSSSGTSNGVGGGSSTTTPSTGIDYSTYYSAKYCYYSDSRKLYFPSDAEARAAGVYDARFVTGSQTTPVTSTYDYSNSVSTTYPWYSSVTNRFYKTSADAIAASGGSSSSVYNYYDRYYYNLYNMYGYSYGYGYNYYPTTTTTTTTDNSNVTIGKYKGWTYVNRYIRSASSGASYTVSMNGETSIPSNVLSTLYGKDVTVNFKFNSGAILSINGKNLSSTSSISTDIKYNTKNVPDSLVKKAVKADDGISTAQFTVSGGNMSASASVTIKFKASRAGCTAKLYRYNSSSNSLSLVSSTVIKSNGNGVFDKVSQGGSYLVVLS